MENTYCAGTNDIQDYSTLQEAKAACINNTECTMIFDYACDGGSWTTCKGQQRSSLSGTCSWLKGNITRDLVGYNIIIAGAIYY